MVHYDTLWQKATDFIKKCDSYFITICENNLFKKASCFLLQYPTALINWDDIITKYDSYYKMRWYISWKIMGLKYRDELNGVTTCLFKLYMKVIFKNLPLIPHCSSLYFKLFRTIESYSFWKSTRQVYKYLHFIIYRFIRLNNVEMWSEVLWSWAGDKCTFLWSERLSLIKRKCQYLFWQSILVMTYDKALFYISFISPTTDLKSSIYNILLRFLHCFIKNCVQAIKMLLQVVIF